MADVLPIRERALARLCDVLDAQVVGAPTADAVRRAYEYEWEDVQRVPIDESDARKRSAIAILEGLETVTPGAGWVIKTLNLTLDFRYFMRADDEQSTIFNRILGEIVRRVREDRTLGGLVIDMRELQNSPDLDDLHDLQIGGQVFFAMVYKTAEDDPAVVSYGAAVPATPSAALP